MKYLYVCKNCNGWYRSNRLLNTLVYQYVCTRCQCLMEKMFENDDISHLYTENELKELFPTPGENPDFPLVDSIWQKDTVLFKIIKINLSEFCPYLDCDQSLCTKCQNKEHVVCILQNQTDMSLIKITTGDLIKYQKVS